VQVFIKAGSGGAGAATFKLLNGRQKGPPDGGSGGKGGDVIFVCNEKLNTLQASTHFKDTHNTHTYIHIYSLTHYFTTHSVTRG
jgi:GTP-binding protein